MLEELKPVKPGYKTTEFWVTILTVVGSATAGLQGVVSPTVAAVLGAVSTVAYAVSRGFAKK